MGATIAGDVAADPDEVARVEGLATGNDYALLLVPLAAVAVSVLGAVLSARGWMRKEAGAAETWPPDHFLAVCGLLTSGFFIFVILVQAIPALVLRVCD